MISFEKQFKVGEFTTGSFRGRTHHIGSFPETLSNNYYNIRQNNISIFLVTAIEFMYKNDYSTKKVVEFINSKVFNGTGSIVVDRFIGGSITSSILKVPSEGSYDNATIYANELQKVVNEGHVKEVTLVSYEVRDTTFDDLLNNKNIKPNLSASMNELGFNGFDKPHRVKVETDLAEMSVDSFGGKMVVAYGLAKHGKFSVKVEANWVSDEMKIRELIALGYTAQYWDNSKPHALNLEGADATPVNILIGKNIYLEKTIYTEDFPAEYLNEFKKYESAQTIHVMEVLGKLFDGFVGETIAPVATSISINPLD